MTLTEQIARALYKADDHCGRPWEDAPSFVQEQYRRNASVVLPFIAAERERCAGVARQYREEAGGSESYRQACEHVEAAIRNQP